MTRPHRSSGKRTIPTSMTEQQRETRVSKEAPPAGLARLYSARRETRVSHRIEEAKTQGERVLDPDAQTSPGMATLAARYSKAAPAWFGGGTAPGAAEEHAANVRSMAMALLRLVR